MIINPIANRLDVAAKILEIGDLMSGMTARHIAAVTMADAADEIRPLSEMCARRAAELDDARAKLESGDATDDVFNDLSGVKHVITADDRAILTMRHVAEALRERDEGRYGEADGLCGDGPAWL